MVDYDETRMQLVNNSTLHLRHSSFLEIKQTNNYGLGVYAKQNIAAGTYLGEFPGVLVKPGTAHFTQLDFDVVRHFVLSNGYMRVQSVLENNFLPLINHSCEPNCNVFESTSRRYRGELNIHYATNKKINAGDQLSIDYRIRTEPDDDLSKYRCLCGSKKCRGTMLDLQYYLSVSK